MCDGVTLCAANVSNCMMQHLTKKAKELVKAKLSVCVFRYIRHQPCIVKFSC